MRKGLRFWFDLFIKDISTSRSTKDMQCSSLAEEGVENSIRGEGCGIVVIVHVRQPYPESDPEQGRGREEEEDQN